MARFEKHIFVCVNERPPGHPRGCCYEKGAMDIRTAFVEDLAQRGLKGIVRANKAGCLDACEMGATVVVYPQAVWYLGVTPDDVAEIVDTSITGDGVVERLVAKPEDWERLRQIRASRAGKPVTIAAKGIL